MANFPATTAVDGLITATNQAKLDGIASGATYTPLSDVAPFDLGVADPGVSTEASRADHVHNKPADANLETIRFTGEGSIQVQTKLDLAWIAPRACTITRITLYRRTAGTSGSTVVDVNKNGTTVYTTQANRPTVAFGAGANAIDATTDMDVTAVAQNDRIEVDVDSKEGGAGANAPKDLAVIIEVAY